MKTDRTKQPGVFRYVEFGDVHLGHRQTPAGHIIKNLDTLVNDQVLQEIDMLIIAGDLFDRQLNNGDEVVHQINKWITMLLYRCAAYNVMIRIVEGTPSHDREQSRFFVEQATNAKIPVDLHYTKHLSIEYIERLDAHFLYVPDKHHPSTAVTLNCVKEEMAKLGLQQVDFAIMHGAFSYQLPSIVEEPTHDENAYLELVKHHILIGHVHIMTVHDRILAAGSFDRICHNDEIPKGMFKVDVREDGTYTATFVENKGAKQYVTLEVHDQDTKQLHHTVQSRLATLPPGSAVRLRCNPNDVATGDIDSFRMQYPKYEWLCVIEKPTDRKNSALESLKNFNLSEFTPITKDTILDLIIPELERYTADAAQLQRCLSRLEEFVTR
jgi:DNA repair exonuclease SbcCD nuclease subunit